MFRMILLSGMIACLSSSASSQSPGKKGAGAEQPKGPSTVLVLPPREGNPRNSEGDFIQLRDGRLLFVYTRFAGGSGDHDAASLVSRVSRDDGKTWSSDDEAVLDNEGGWNVMSVSLLRLHDGRIALFYMRKNSATDCRPFLRYSDDEARSWSEAVAIIPDEQIGYYVLNNDRVIQLEDGRLVVPVALHHQPDWKSPDWKGQVMGYLSDDMGSSWRRSRTIQKAYRPGGERITAQEPGVVQLKGGRLMMWVRTDEGEQYWSHSQDGAETWSVLKPMGVASPRSPASIRRLPGREDLLMVWNDHSALALHQRTARTPLSLAVSRDEGNTWSSPRNIADDPEGWYCYTAIEFVGDQVLLGYVAGKQRKGEHLATTQLTRLPIDWCYGD